MPDLEDEAEGTERSIRLTVKRRRKAIRTPRVYFVQAAKLGLIKIGFAADIQERLGSLQVGSPDRLALIGAIYDKDALAIEARLHSRFRKDREHGEWFRPSAELLAYIAEWTVERADALEYAEGKAQADALHGLPDSYDEWPWPEPPTLSV
ncbi:MAG: GIY-YIG nuclease family protein [Phenylobacterium sp.]|nr:GIY-YIG nuclease family protein [Phenylobacterium sp.]